MEDVNKENIIALYDETVCGVAKGKLDGLTY